MEPALCLPSYLPSAYGVIQVDLDSSQLKTMEAWTSDIEDDRLCDVRIALANGQESSFPYGSDW